MLSHLLAILSTKSPVRKRPVNFNDNCLGDYEGDILQALAALFPPTMAQRISRHSPIVSRWQAVERVTYEGFRGHHFFTDQKTCDAVNRVFDDVYEDQHKQPKYPGFYSLGTEAERLPKACILSGRVVIWQPGTIDFADPECGAES